MCVYVCGVRVGGGGERNSTRPAGVECVERASPSSVGARYLWGGRAGDVNGAENYAARCAPKFSRGRRCPLCGGANSAMPFTLAA
jgi:hypothetical protein